MELTCPHCAARYRVALDAIPAEGREVHCVKCGLSWVEHGGTDTTARMIAHDEPLAGGMPDFGGVELATMPIGPAATERAPPLELSSGQPPWELDTTPRAGGLGTTGWLLLLLVLALIGAGVYAYETGMLRLP